MPVVRAYCRSFLFAAVLGLILPACGGGGGTGADAGPQLPSKILSWSPPTAYTDGSTLNPTAELDSFEIYVNTSGSFNGSEPPLAYVRAVDPATHRVTTEFDLANLGPYLSTGVVYRVSLRAVALTGARSDFSPAASFSF